ncbi:MAG: TRAP transporter small permease subunit [Candidatus Thiodiazotropha taylori]|nr:TRAP transporter small permease subunit [Candidatus Thiodiazotropha taylori]MCW4225957.1 TRAP transporter small permease subunit [Candidatus Thiodiazotropha endolucinida]MCG7881304.1 TRAP transporter small permease subunit [Candidatus Thiodiazotropha taylori]MCG7887525.1 TRAP transporter small permease subunit [Candidatus Thiodiazotropha taylori]MCG7889282.1 TRAP transporter small permease subunit [Candidatus Thiodiazotropha taylori]
MSVTSPASEYHIPIVAWLNGIVRRIAETTAWLNVALILVIVVQVVMRYGFNKGMVPLEELMWHLYAVAFMFGMAYAVTNDSHIRVDVVHMALPKRAQHLFEIVGILLLLMPVLWILFDHSLGWAIEAYRVNESSQNPTGLPYRWIIKSVVPATMVLIFMAALARLIQEVSLLFHFGKEPDDQFPGRVSMMRRLFKPQQRKDDHNDGGVR